MLLKKSLFRKVSTRMLNKNSYLNEDIVGGNLTIKLQFKKILKQVTISVYL